MMTTLLLRSSLSLFDLHWNEGPTPTSVHPSVHPPTHSLTHPSPHPHPHPHRNKQILFKDKTARAHKNTAISWYVINTYNLSCFLSHTHSCALCIFSPFRLFSEIARPLSKVRFAKGRVHFHIFPFDMRRLSIQGYVFLS